MGYKNPYDERRIDKDFAYMNSERGYITRAISGKFKPSYGKSGGHVPALDKKEIWRLYMNHLINMKEIIFFHHLYSIIFTILKRKFCY